MRALSAVASLSVIATFFGAVAAACALNTEGLHANEEPVGPDASTIPDASTTPDASTGLDASDDAEPPPDGPLPMCNGNPADCTDPVPTGWTRIGYAGDRNTPCDKGFTSMDVFADWAASDSACTCGDCVVTNDPSCSSGMVQTSLDNGNGKCDKQGQTVSAASSGDCVDVNGDLGANFKGTPPAATGGSCSAQSVANNEATTSTLARVCVPEGPECEGQLCAQPGAYKECIQAAGQQNCPTEFSASKRVIATSVNVACGGCDCSVTASCSATFTFYTSSNCMGTPIQLPVDNTCVPTNNDGTTVKAYRYESSVISPTCSSSNKPSTTLMLDSPKTICCK